MASNLTAEDAEKTWFGEGVVPVIAVRADSRRVTENTEKF